MATRTSLRLVKVMARLAVFQLLLMASCQSQPAAITNTPASPLRSEPVLDAPSVAVTGGASAMRSASTTQPKTTVTSNSSSAPSATNAPDPPAPTRVALQNLDLELRSSLPQTLAFDGKLEEWGIQAASRPSLIIALTPSRFVTVLRLPNIPPSPFAFEIGLPGGDLPEIGIRMRGSGAHKVNCERRPWPGGKRLGPTERARCLRMVNEHALLRRPYRKRFRAQYRFDPKQRSWHRNDDATPVTLLRQACSEEARALVCESDWPLTALPRTTALELDSVTISVVSARTSSEAARSVPLPQSIRFDSGRDVHELVMPEAYAGDLSAGPRYSYQPGAGAEYEIAERDRLSDLNFAMSRVVFSTCRPGPVVATLGEVSVYSLCDKDLYIVYAGTQAMATAPWGKVLTRDGAVSIIAVSDTFNDSSIREEIRWEVATYRADGSLVSSERLEILADCAVSPKAIPDEAFDTLTLECQAYKTYGEESTELVRRVWHWNPSQQRYVK